MVFSSTVFLFLFLPAVLAAVHLSRRRWRNALILLASLLFYAWGEPAALLVMLVSIAVNGRLGRFIHEAPGKPTAQRWLTLGLVFNIGLLCAFKYGHFLWDNLAEVAGSVGLGDWPTLTTLLSGLATATGLVDQPLPADWHIHLPIGISFFSFQAMSYLIDLHRGDARVQRNFVDFATYIALFPQLIAGPIVRYRHIAEQLVERTHSWKQFASGVRRFVVGLGKKVLIADVLAETADTIFALDGAQLSPGVAWLGLLCYTLQIYFDFSGYSDMAIGLGRMLGFEFLENFNFPYIARSITDFWRRWHISLSTWFRDYLYVPLGGNRHGRLATARNLLIVFLLCGLWHGAAWTYVVWGLFHGAFLIFERSVGRERMARMPALLGHAYTLFAVMIGWALFRAETFDGALALVGGLFTVGTASAPHHVAFYNNPVVTISLIAGLIGSLPWTRVLTGWHAGLATGSLTRRAADLAGLLVLVAIMTLSAMQMAAQSYTTFIYFRF